MSLVQKNVLEEKKGDPENANKLEAGDVASLKHMADIAASNISLLSSLEQISQRLVQRTTNATEHLDDDQIETLKEVLDMINTTIFKSMDLAHGTDQRELKRLADEISNCNTDIETRLGDTGDIGIMHQRATEFQAQCADNMSVVEDKGNVQAGVASQFNTHVNQIPEAPDCSQLPKPTTEVTLDAFFTASSYVAWFGAQQERYHEKSDAMKAAREDLATAELNLAKCRSSLTVEYCDWKTALESGCAYFNDCYDDRLDEFNTQVAKSNSSMHLRMRAYQAGRAIQSHISYLLGLSKFEENATQVDTSGYQLEFPMPASKGSCPLGPLTDAQWTPAIVCSETNPTGMISLHVQPAAKKHPTTAAITKDA